MNRERNIVIGNKIREALKFEKRSVKNLGEAIGIAPQTLYSIMNGHQSPSLDKIERIANELHISIDYLLDIEVTSLPIFPSQYQESLNYASFEDRWFGDTGGERISVSRNFSTTNQSIELRREILKNVYHTPPEKINETLEAFQKRLHIISQKELNRIEIVVDSEVEDFILQRAPWDDINPALIVDFAENVIRRLKNEPMRFDVTIIPRQYFLVNYEIIRRQVILLDLGSVYYRQNHPKMLEHFIREVERFKYDYNRFSTRDEVIAFIEKLLEEKKA